MKNINMCFSPLFCTYASLRDRGSRGVCHNQVSSVVAMRSRNSSPSNSYRVFKHQGVVAPSILYTCLHMLSKWHELLKPTSSSEAKHLKEFNVSRFNSVCHMLLYTISFTFSEIEHFTEDVWPHRWASSFLKSSVLSTVQFFDILELCNIFNVTLGVFSYPT